MVHIVPGWDGGGYETVWTLRETNMFRKICVEKFVVVKYVVEDFQKKTWGRRCD